MSSRLGFTELPAEIRIMIYKLAFISDKPISVSGQPGGENTLSGQLLRTCRMIREEGSPILYGENTFLMECKSFISTTDLVRVFEGFGESAKFIRHLQAHEYAACAVNSLRSVRTLREMLQGLESLEITLLEGLAKYRWYYGTPGSRKRRPYILDLREWVKVARGPFQNLTRVFLERTPRAHHYWPEDDLRFTLISGSEKVKPPVCP
jgi:hypothetical protein